MAINKVEANGETLIDLTSDTVTADTLVSGRTAHLASGERVTGTFEPVTGVKGNAESAYRKGNVNLTPANIGAATSAQGTKADSAVQTIQIGGTTQTKTSGTVNLPAYPTKSSLGLGNVDNTSDANKPISTAQQTALNGKVSKGGDTMTGELKTSFNCVANGSIAIESKVGGFPVTLSKFIDTVRYSSGCSGSVQFSAYTFGNITIPAGWYNFEWLPHRTGGNNGSAQQDNCNYGALILTGMTVANAGYIVKYTSQAITEVHELYKGEELVELTQKALLKEDDNAGGYVVDLDKDCKLQRNSNYIHLRNNSINIHADSSNISLQCGTTGSPLRGVSITSTAVRMYFGLNTLTVDEDGLWFNGTKIAE